jgi:tetratricopeptide (TPR) repeat protein
LPPNASTQAQIGRAIVLIELDQLEAARGLLEPLAAQDVTITLLLASVLRDQERWSESDVQYSRALERLLPQATTNVNAQEGCRAAFEGLAFNARADGRPADAERVLRRGKETLPDEIAYFDFQLGKHYHDGGRPHLAMEHLRSAADRNPTQYQAPAEKLIRSLRTTTPACLPKWGF